MDYITILGLVAGALTTISLVPQITKIHKTKSANDISTLMFITSTIGISLWIIYGLIIKSFPVIIANSISVIFTISVLGLKFRYRKNK